MNRRTRQCNSYAFLYNGAVLRGERLDSWIRTRIKGAKDTASRYYVSRHVLTLARTQTLGAKLDHTTIEMARRVHRLCIIRRNILLRRCQRRVIEYLWRPGGKLDLRHRPYEMLSA